MARKKLTANLDTLIPQYAENKSMLDDYKKICDDENKQIKELMSEGKYSAGGYVATKSIYYKESINEDKLLEVLNRDREMAILNGIIRVKEYVDMDSLEKAIYNGNVSKETLLEIDKCREKKEVVTLRVAKEKEA